MSDHYDITVEQTGSSDWWHYTVRYNHTIIQRSGGYGFPTKEMAKEIAQNGATSHARSLSSRETYSFTPTL